MAIRGFDKRVWFKKVPGKPKTSLSIVIKLKRDTEEAESTVAVCLHVFKQDMNVVAAGFFGNRYSIFIE